MKSDIHAVNPHDSLFEMLKRKDNSAADKLIEDAKAGKQIRVL